MVKIRSHQELVPSVFDRLIKKRVTGKQYRVSVAQLKSSIRRDLEDLLNTRQCSISLPPGLGRLDSSLVNYGVPDPLGYDLSSPERIESFREQIEMVIRRFETRFTRVSISLPKDRGIPDRILRFRIEAAMYVELRPELLIFSLQVEPSTRQIKVARGS